MAVDSVFAELLLSDVYTGVDVTQMSCCSLMQVHLCELRGGVDAEHGPVSSLVTVKVLHASADEKARYVSDNDYTIPLLQKHACRRINEIITEVKEAKLWFS